MRVFAWCCVRAELRDGQLVLDEGKAADGDGAAATDGAQSTAGDSKLEQFAIPSQLQQRHLEVCSLPGRHSLAGATFPGTASLCNPMISSWLYTVAIGAVQAASDGARGSAALKMWIAGAAAVARQAWEGKPTVPSLHSL